METLFYNHIIYIYRDSGAYMFIVSNGPPEEISIGEAIKIMFDEALDGKDYLVSLDVDEEPEGSLEVALRVISRQDGYKQPN